MQGRLGTQLHSRVAAELAAGWFQAAPRRNGSRDLGTEIGAMLTLSVAEGMHLNTGAAGAFLGDFFAPDADDLFEVFTRFELQY